MKHLNNGFAFCATFKPSAFVEESLSLETQLLVLPKYVLQLNTPEHEYVVNAALYFWTLIDDGFLIGHEKQPTAVKPSESKVLDNLHLFIRRSHLKSSD